MLETSGHWTRSFHCLKHSFNLKLYKFLRTNLHCREAGKALAVLSGFLRTNAHAILCPIPLSSRNLWFVCQLQISLVRFEGEQGLTILWEDTLTGRQTPKLRSAGHLCFYLTQPYPAKRVPSNGSSACLLESGSEKRTSVWQQSSDKTWSSFANRRLAVELQAPALRSIAMTF